MELNRRDLRAMIFYDFKAGLTATHCYERMQQALDVQAPSFATIKNWYKEFRNGRVSLDDSSRTGRPSEVVNDENIAAVREAIENDPKVTYATIEATLLIHPPQIHSILHDHLHVVKRTPRWVPRNLTEEQKAARVEWCHFMKNRFRNGESRSVENLVTGDETWIYQFEPERKQQSQVWLFPDEQLPVKSRRTRSSGKQMVLTFFSSAGAVSTSILQERRTVNAEWYCTVGLAELFQRVKEMKPRSGMRDLIFHHDNAPAHTAARTVQFLEKNHVSVIPHPPYSPDLAPADFFLFPKVKGQTRGRQYPSSEAAVTAYNNALQNMSREDFKNCFMDWFKRMDKCIAVGGAYFEKI